MNRKLGIDSTRVLYISSGLSFITDVKNKPFCVAYYVIVYQFEMIFRVISHAILKITRVTNRVSYSRNMVSPTEFMPEDERGSTRHKDTIRHLRDR